MGSGSSAQKYQLPNSSQVDLLLSRRTFVLQAEAEKRGWMKALRAADPRQRPLQNAPEHLKKDRDVVIASNYDLQFAPDELRNDKHFVLTAVRSRGLALINASDELKRDKEVVMAAVKSDEQALFYASSDLKKDKTVVMTAVQAFGWALEGAGSLRADKEVVMSAVHQNGLALRCAAISLRADREVVLTAVTSNGSALELASTDLQEDKAVVMAAVRATGCALRLASVSFQADKEIVMAAVQNDGNALQFATASLWADQEVVMAAVHQNGDALLFADESFEADREVVITAVKSNGKALQYASIDFREDKTVVMAAVQQEGEALQFAADFLQADWEVALAAIKSKTAAVAAELEEIQSHSKEEITAQMGPHRVETGVMNIIAQGAPALMSDKGFATAVVEFRGWYLRWFSMEMCNDPDIVLAAVMENGRTMEFASDALLNDRSFVLRAVQSTKATWLLNYCSRELQDDKEFQELVKQAAGTGLVFTYYHSFSCFDSVRNRFVATGASVPGGTAYDHVMTQLNKTSGGTATVWFDEIPVFGFSANNGEWVHPSEDCGRDYVSVPPQENRHEMWNSMVESRTTRLWPPVGSKHPCWCCHWLRKVKQKHAEGAVICIAVSNIYNKDWVDKYGAGSSELSDEAADKFGLKREQFRNGRPAGWGTGEMQISNGMTFSRVAPVHPHTGLPLGEGCRWERQALDRQNFAVYAYFVP